MQKWNLGCSIFRRRQWARIFDRPSRIAALCAAFALVFGAPALLGTWVWDDLGLIVEVPKVMRWSYVPDLFLRPMLGGYVRPLAALSHIIECSIYGLENPWGFHLTNIVLHALGTAGVACLTWSLASGENARLRARASLLGGLIFALAPIHSENLAWLSGRHDLLAAVFSIWAVLGYIKFRRRRSTSALAFCLLLTALACYGKESGMATIALCITWECSRTKSQWNREGFTALALMALVTLVYLIHRSLIVQGLGRGVDPQSWAQLASFFASIPRYLRWSLAPTELNAYHDSPLIVSFLDLRVLLGIGLCVVFLALSWSDRRWRLPLLGFLGTLAPTCGVMALGRPEDVEYLCAERWLYYATMFLYPGLAIALAKRWSDSRVRAATALILVAWLGLALPRYQDWRDDRRFWQVTEGQAPRSWVASYNLGVAELKANQPGAALAAFERSIARARRAKRENPDAELGRTLALQALKDRAKTQKK